MGKHPRHEGEPDLYDLNALSRFVSAVLANEKNPEPDKSDMVAVAHALLDMFFGTDLHRKFKLHKRPTETDKRKTMHSGAMTIVMAALNNEFPDDGISQRQHALNEIDKLYGFNTGKQESAQELWKEILNSAAENLELHKVVWRNAGWGEYKALPAKSVDEQIQDIAASSMTYNKKIEAIQTLTGLERPEAQRRLVEAKNLQQ